MKMRYLIRRYIFMIHFAAGKLYNRLKPVVRLSFFRNAERLKVHTAKKLTAYQRRDTALRC